MKNLTREFLCELREYGIDRIDLHNVDVDEVFAHLVALNDGPCARRFHLDPQDAEAEDRPGVVRRWRTAHVYVFGVSIAIVGSYSYLVKAA